MKQNALKILIKQAVKEAIQEELKDILLEAVKTPRQTVVEHIQPTQPIQQPPVEGPSMGSRERRAAYQNILGDMGKTFNSQHVERPLQMSGPMDTTSQGSSLPDGNVSMNQIMGLLNTK